MNESSVFVKPKEITVPDIYEVVQQVSMNILVNFFQFCLFLNNIKYLSIIYNILRFNFNKTIIVHKTFVFDLNINLIKFVIFIVH